MQLWLSANWKQFWRPRDGSHESLGFNGSGNISSEIQPPASTLLIFNGSFGNDRRLVQLFKNIDSNFESRMMLSGRQTKSFPLRCNHFKENKEPISLGIALRLQSVKCNWNKEDAGDRDREENSKSMGWGLVGIEQNGRSSYHDLLDDNPLHPLNFRSPRCFKRPMEEGTFLIAVLLKSKYSRLSTFPRFSGSHFTTSGEYCCLTRSCFQVER